MRKESACGIVVLASMTAWAQVGPPSVPQAQTTTLRAVFLEGDLQVEAGEFCVRGPDSEVFRYRFDAKTHFERDGLVTTLPLLRTGERVEITSSPIFDSPLRYAVSVLAVDPLPAPRIAPRPRTRTIGTPLEPQFQRGDLTFSGVISFLADGRLILRTHSGEQTLLLRQDTRFLESGNVVHGSDLKANMRVFVRAGKDLFGHMEAYQVMWGGFLQPHD
jgi:hypothetical protein